MNKELPKSPKLSKNPNWKASIQRSAVGNQTGQKNGKSVQNAALPVHEPFSRKIILLALARFGLAWYINKRRKRCGSRCDVQRGAGQSRKEIESTGIPGHLMQSR